MIQRTVPQRQSSHFPFPGYRTTVWLRDLCLSCTVIVLATAAGTTPLPAGAEEPTLPAADQLLGRLAEALGAAATTKVERITSSGTLELAGAGISGSLVLYQARPDRSLTVVELQGLGAIRSGTGDGLAWELSDVQGPRLLEGSERAFALRSAAIDLMTDWKQYYSTAETTGNEQLDGRRFYLLRMTPATGSPETWWLDQETALLHTINLDLETIMGTVEVEVTLGDYRRVSGLMMPFRVSHRTLGQEMITVLEKVEINPTLDSDLFIPPSEVRELLWPVDSRQ